MKERTKCRLAILEKPWANVLTKYCVFVAKNPTPFIVIPLILTVALSTGIIFKFKIVRGVHFLYAPIDAEWKTEEDVFNTHWAASDNLFYPGKDVLRRKGVYLMMTAKDGKSVVRKNYASEFIAILDWLESVNVTNHHGDIYSYRDICLRFRNACFNNAHTRIAADKFITTRKEDFDVTYPYYVSSLSSEKIDLSQALGNVTLDKNGRIESASSWMVLYQLRQDSTRTLDLSTNFELAIESAVREGKVPGKLLNVYCFHSNSFDNELADSNMRLIPRFAITFGILITFSVACTFNLFWVWNGKEECLVTDWVLSKPLMGLAGVFTTMMAILSAMGLLLLLDVTFVDMCTVMPFLSLTIGIDDTFLILAAWHDTPRHFSVEERIRRAMRHAAVSISITSLTDTIAFLIGAVASLPAVRYFCFYSAAAIAFIFFYSMSIFVALLTLQGRREQRGVNSVTGANTKHSAMGDHLSLIDMHFNMGSRPERSPLSRITSQKQMEYGLNMKCIDSRLWYQRFFEDTYAKFIWRPEIRLLSVLLFTLYIFGTITGMQRLVVGFDLVNIVQRDAQAHKFLEIRNSEFPESMARTEIAVMNPPDMTDVNERNRFLRILREFESTPCSEGSTSTEFWYSAYKDYVKELGFGEMWADFEKDKEAFTSNLNSFLLSSDRYSFDVLRNENGSLHAFRLSTGLSTLKTDYRIVECCRMFRDIARRHSEYEISTYTPFWNLADQFEIMWPQTMQDIYISICVMIPIALLFIEQPLCAVTIGLNIASVAFGVLGFMAWWDVNLDATSMITIAMSVGFSVDFAAHVTYAYMMEAGGQNNGDYVSPRKRLAATLGIVGWPVAQASSSVLLGISTLATVDSYVVQTCFKTVMLVVIFGSAHALFFLPLLLSNFHALVDRFTNRGRFVVNTIAEKKVTATRF